MFVFMLRAKKIREWSLRPSLSYQTGSLTIPALIFKRLIDDLGEHKKTRFILEREREEEHTWDGMGMSISMRFPKSLFHWLAKSLGGEEDCMLLKEEASSREILPDPSGARLKSLMRIME